jgi:flagellar basal body rod protein FlgB
MNIAPAIEDNVAEVLSRISEFTLRRRQLITQNILNVNVAGYEPADLDSDEFANLMALAVSEHIENRRLLLRDGHAVRFGSDGTFEADPVVDLTAKQLLAEDTEAYMKYQFQKLTETLINNRFAAALQAKRQWIPQPNHVLKED